MSDIREYRIVSDHTAGRPASDQVTLTEQVEALLAEGWEPLGGPLIKSKDTFHTEYSQAMIRRDDGIRYRNVSAPPGIADDMPPISFEDLGIQFPNHEVWQPEDE